VNLKKRVVSVENKLFCKINRIEGWALKVAKDEASHRDFLRRSILMLNRVAEREGWATREPGTHLFELNSREKILNFAKELSKKYTSLEDYKLNRPEPTFSGRALNEIIQRYEKERFSGS